MRHKFQCQCEVCSKIYGILKESKQPMTTSEIRKSLGYKKSSNGYRINNHLLVLRNDYKVLKAGVDNKRLRVFELK